MTLHNIYKEGEKRFDMFFPYSVENLQRTWHSLFTHSSNAEEIDIKSHIRSLTIKLLKGQIEEWEGMRRGANLGGTAEERDNYFYNLALEKVITQNRELIKELEK